MSKRFYQYDSPNGKKWGYRREYSGKQLRKKGFDTKANAESDLRQAMADIDATKRGEVRSKPTTAQEALDIYRHNLDVRARDKSYQYAHNVRSNCKVLQEFVDRFGPNLLIREATETDLREFYQLLCFRPTLSKNSAAVFVGRVQGMFKAAQKAKPDLVNWLRPTLTVKRKTEYERRIVTPDEYQTPVRTLLNPPRAASHIKDRNTLWRDTADAVQLLRQTGGRLNEVLRIKLDQFDWKKDHVTLFASKTENERAIPLWGNIKQIVQRRIRENLTDGEYLFPRAKVMTFDNAIARACRKAAKLANINYGQANGFTCHSFRHTFATDLMKKTGNDAGTVMKYTGHKTIESFSIYLKPTDRGRILATQAMDGVALTVDGFLTASKVDGVNEVEQVSSSTKAIVGKKRSVIVS